MENKKKKFLNRELEYQKREKLRFEREREIKRKRKKFTLSSFQVEEDENYMSRGHRV